MNRRKAWWAVGIFNYSFKVQLFYYLAVFCIVPAVPAIRKAQFIPLKWDSNLLTLIAIVIVFIICVLLFAKFAKKEYVEKNLG